MGCFSLCLTCTLNNNIYLWEWEMWCFLGGVVFGLPRSIAHWNDPFPWNHTIPFKHQPPLNLIHILMTHYVFLQFYWHCIIIIISQWECYKNKIKAVINGVIYLFPPKRGLSRSWLITSHCWYLCDATFISCSTPKRTVYPEWDWNTGRFWSGLIDFLWAFLN